MAASAWMKVTPNASLNRDGIPRAAKALVRRVASGEEDAEPDHVEPSSGTGRLWAELPQPDVDPVSGQDASLEHLTKNF